VKLDQVTPIVLTANEEANIGRCLDGLRWAREVLVLDSGSSDATARIVGEFQNARLVVRSFDDFAGQWNFALNDCGIRSEWVLALDADFIAPEELRQELESLEPTADCGGWRARFVYCVQGRPLRGSVYPPITVLVRRAGAVYRQVGHAYRVEVRGWVGELRARLRHDDRKPLERFVRSQLRYMSEEAELLLSARWGDLGWPDRIRTLHVVAPFAVFAYCLLVRRGLLDGRAGLHYATQRMFAETLLSLTLLERRLR
jgi:glycosyltransferase involved in cell wall biosynthesis